KDITGESNCFLNRPSLTGGLYVIEGCIFNPCGGQIDFGLMIKNLSALAHQTGIEILYNIHITEIQHLKNAIELKKNFAIFKSEFVIVATNGFAGELLDIADVKPARAQVLITKPIPDLKLKGTFHLEKGYYYFRNINNRILLGGGRNLDFKTEQTTSRDLNPRIQDKLDEMLKGVILPGKKFEVDIRWTGIMGVGNEKKPIIKKTGRNCVAAVRMGGMGVAIGSLVGHLAAEKLLN